MEVRLSPKTVRELLGHDIGHSVAEDVMLPDDRRALREILESPDEEALSMIEEDAPRLADRIEGSPDGQVILDPHKSGATTIKIRTNGTTS